MSRFLSRLESAALAIGLVPGKLLAVDVTRCYRLCITSSWFLSRFSLLPPAGVGALALSPSDVAVLPGRQAVHTRVHWASRGGKVLLDRSGFCGSLLCCLCFFCAVSFSFLLL